MSEYSAWLYSPEFPEGEIFHSEASVQAALDAGWVDSPAALDIEDEDGGAADKAQPVAPRKRGRPRKA